jgi:hypothetical protein
MKGHPAFAADARNSLADPASQSGPRAQHPAKTALRAEEKKGFSPVFFAREFADDNSWAEGMNCGGFAFDDAL